MEISQPCPQWDPLELRETLVFESDFEFLKGFFSSFTLFLSDLTSFSSIFSSNSTLGETSPPCLSVRLTKSKRTFWSLNLTLNSWEVSSTPSQGLMFRDSAPNPEGVSKVLVLCLCCWAGPGSWKRQRCRETANISKILFGASWQH